MSDAEIRHAKPTAKADKLTDSNRLPLLGVSAGGKLWRLNYALDGKQKSMASGQTRSRRWAM